MQANAWEASGADDASASRQAAACERCPLGLGRREFVRAGALAVAALALAGVDVGRAEALPIRAMRAMAARGSTLTYNLPTSDGVYIDRVYEVILARYQGRVYAFSLSCPHQRTALRWVSDQEEFECPKHHSKYRPDGTYISGRATRSMDRYALQIQGGKVLVDYSERFRQDKDPTDWAAASAVVPPGA
jgi:nitrite reductase/ring-hydroxylating ferredoxin subunit